MLTALMAPALMLFVGIALDFARWSNQRTSLKQLSDMLATRGAREFLLAQPTAEQIKAVIAAAVDDDIAEFYKLHAFSYDTTVSTSDTTVTVEMTLEPIKGLFLTKFKPYSRPIKVQSTAVARGGMNVCVVSLASSADRAVSADLNARLSAEECSIMANSNSPTSVSASFSSKLTAQMICTGGGYSGTLVNYEPLPTTDCPAYPDPLSAREAPPIGGCDFIDTTLGERSTEVFMAALSDSFASLAPTEELVVETQNFTTHTLSPGVYCGGLAIASNADVRLEPGHYVMKDGPLVVDLGARLSGENVSFYLEGDDSTFYFGADSKISLTAPNSGPLAGILFFEDRNAPLDRIHRIHSDDARTLLGTFYLPRGTLSVASLLPVADQSAYTAIVANKLLLAGSPTLVLNADYNMTDIPVPAGVGPIGGNTYLRE